jgi:hypothetical protein
MRTIAAACLASCLLATPLAARADDKPCALELHAGVPDDDAQAIEDIVCEEVHAKLEGRGVHRVRVAKLGGKVVLTLVETQPNGPRTEKQLVLSGIEEVPVAAPRLADAIAETKVIEETQNVTNIVGTEARPYKKKTSEVHALLEMVGLAAIGPKSGSGAGVQLGIAAGSESWAFLGELRLAGGATDHVALTGGTRHFFSTSDTSPFAGMGMGIETMNVDRNTGGGLAFYLEAGVDVLRTRQFGGLVGVRFDVPTFAIDKGGTRYYAPVAALELAMRF